VRSGPTQPQAPPGTGRSEALGRRSDIGGPYVARKMGEVSSSRALPGAVCWQLRSVPALAPAFPPYFRGHGCAGEQTMRALLAVAFFAVASLAQAHAPRSRLRSRAAIWLA
jgi:hypothetical protein